jgi:hypothetical protein
MLVWLKPSTATRESTAEPDSTRMYASLVTATTQSSGRRVSAARSRALATSPSRTGNRTVVPSNLRTRYSRISTSPTDLAAGERDSAQATRAVSSPQAGPLRDRKVG